MAETTSVYPDPYGRSYWWATCDHGDSVWVIERSTKYLARRSLAAHVRDEHSGRTV